MARKPSWNEAPLKNGIGEYTLRSWRHFYDFIHKEMLEFQAYIWRGQRLDESVLESTLDRLVRKAKIGSSIARKQFRDAHLSEFKLATRGRRGNSPPTLHSENDWWALGQHHGLSTPLLDWTTSPFVAAYFAFIETGDNQSKYRPVYALSQPLIEKKVREISREEEAKRKIMIEESRAGKRPAYTEALFEKFPVRPDIEFIRPMSDENLRLVNQAGLFTRSPDDTNLEDWVRAHFEENETRYVLLKIRIPNSDREQCLKALNRMNINHLTLFPDLYGASIYCNTHGEIKRY